MAAPRLPEAVPPQHEQDAPVGQAAGGGKTLHPRDGAKQAARSDGYATCVDRAYVQKEIRWALKYQKPIITVYESESHRPGYFDYAKAAEKYKGTEWEFLLGIDAIKYQREQFLAEAMLKNILAKALGSVDVGQAVVVQQNTILGVEAIEGTDALIARCAGLGREGPGGVLVKVAKPGQEQRVDLPTIGVRTVEVAAEAGLRGIAVEAAATVVVGRQAVAKAADRAKLFVVGVRFPW